MPCTHRPGDRLDQSWIIEAVTSSRAVYQHNMDLVIDLYPFDHAAVVCDQANLHN